MAEAVFVNDARVMSKGQVTIPKNVRLPEKFTYRAEMSVSSIRQFMPYSVFRNR